MTLAKQLTLIALLKSNIRFIKKHNMKINFLKILIAFTFFSNLAMASFEFKDIYDQPFETIARFLE